MGDGDGQYGDGQYGDAGRGDAGRGDAERDAMARDGAGGMILFRVEAGPAIGAGHAMRSLALAEAALDRGVGAQFVFHLVGTDRPGPMIERRLESAGIVWYVACPGADVGSNPGDSDPVFGADALVIDGYCLGDAVWRSLRGLGVPVLTFEDCLPPGAIGPGSVPVDLVVNPAADPRDALRRPAGTGWLFGPDYVMLRRELRHAACQPPWPMAHRDGVLVSFGGSDPARLTVPVVRAFVAALAAATHEHVPVSAIVGGLVPDADAVMRDLGMIGPMVRAYHDPPHLGRLMQVSGLALSAAGGTVGELAALAVPSVVAVVADNQVTGAAKAVAGGLVRAVDVRGLDPVTAANRLVVEAMSLWHDPVLRGAMAARGAGLIDPDGAGRVADALISLMAVPRKKIPRLKASLSVPDGH